VLQHPPGDPGDRRLGADQVCVAGDRQVVVPLTQGQVTTIDDVDSDLAELGWYAIKGDKTFYAARHVRKRDGTRPLERLHQVIARRMGIVGPPDHKDRNGLNNLRNNLRPATRRQNEANKGLQVNNTSGFRGVGFFKRASKWRAQISVNSKLRHLGFFDDPIEAAKAYDRAALAEFAEFAFLNFPEGRSL
jgi:hypothetical protein